MNETKPDGREEAACSLQAQVRRCPLNPLISPSDAEPSQSDLKVVGTFNAGAARVGDEVILLVRVAERPIADDPNVIHAPYMNLATGRIESHVFRLGDPDLKIDDERTLRYRGEFYLTSHSHLRVARSRDGICFTIDDEPILSAAMRYECFGIEDPRITKIDDDYLVTYKAVSEHGITTALAWTSDFCSFERLGTIFCPENLDVVIFPEKIGGQYAALTRPVGVHHSLPSIWMARSDDLIHWGKHQPVMAPLSMQWDSARGGAGCVPFRQGEYWVEIYHGADASNRYSAGVALLDSSDPSLVVARSSQPFLVPEKRYELNGFFGGVVFPCGHALASDGVLTIYYGAADETVCAVELSVEELVESVW